VKTLIAFLAASLIATAHAQMPKRDNPECKQPNPVFAKFPNAFTVRCERSTFAKLDIQTAKDPARIDGDYTMVPKEGEFWMFAEQIVPAAGKAYPSYLEVFRNYENALKQAGGTIVGVNGQRGFHYRIERPSGEYWGFVGCAGGAESGGCGGSIHRIVRIAAMQQSVVISADQIQRSLAEAGKVVFYGIYFDTDKATLKAESEPTLAEMAKFMRSDAALKVFIVGHTDMQGGVERNQKLSQERAAAVVAALAGKHGVAKERMTAAGVGPLAPVAPNDGDTGRARNRRVEMVLR
jgi:outer membrane protein OmpA-like peptidoglycan-associated protein